MGVIILPSPAQTGDLTPTAKHKVLDRPSAGRVRAASPNVIEVGPNAFASSEEMARTLAHELNHARSFLRGGVAPESSGYGAEGYLSEWMAGLR